MPAVNVRVTYDRAGRTTTVCDETGMAATKEVLSVCYAWLHR